MYMYFHFFTCYDQKQTAFGHPHYKVHSDRFLRFPEIHPGWGIASLVCKRGRAWSRSSGWDLHAKKHILEVDWSYREDFQHKLNHTIRWPRHRFWLRPEWAAQEKYIKEMMRDRVCTRSFSTRHLDIVMQSSRTQKPIASLSLILHRELVIEK